MKLFKSDVDAVDLESVRPFVANHQEFFARDWHYRLLGHLAMRFPSRTVIDIGTNCGDSALALSFGGGQVHSFDIEDRTSDRPRRENVVYHIEDLWNLSVREKWKLTLLESAVVFIDIAPHDGAPELELVRWFEANGYRGILVLDDIWYYKRMRDELWGKLDERHKTDVTRLGHWSGTGIVCFDRRVKIENEPDTSAWTMVTGYFDLASRSDASPEMLARPEAHYLDTHGPGTLAIDENLIVFCEPRNVDKVWRLRPARLHDRTRVVVREFDEFPMSRYHPRIVANRGGPWCPTDPRMTASYYLLCMARYAMMREAMSSNPFRSTHFGWINICIERVGWKNLMHLDEALGESRDKFSTCFIDYVPKNVVMNWDQFFGGSACIGRCTMSSGFFTGREDYLREASELLEGQFLRCLAAGYGHADEQLYPMIYFDRPDLFDWYPGDYAEVVTNYARVNDRPEQPIVNLISRSFEAGDFGVCARAAAKVMEGHTARRYQIADRELEKLLDIMRRVC